MSNIVTRITIHKGDGMTTTTRERPILFNGDMVRAILAGRKTQTRRVVNPQPQRNGGQGFSAIKPYRNSLGKWTWVLEATGIGDGTSGFFSPFGLPGDRLWVRESFAYVNDVKMLDPGSYALGCGCFYRADEYDLTDDDFNPVKWNPSIHMPRRCSRITLEITDVRVERLQDISGQDAISEGVTIDEWDYESFEMTVDQDAFHCGECGGDGFVERQEYYSDYINEDPGDVMPCPECREITEYRQRGAAGHSFRRLWNSINSKAHPWSSNPWVWVVSFKKVETA